MSLKTILLEFRVSSKVLFGDLKDRQEFDKYENQVIQVFESYFGEGNLERFSCPVKILSAENPGYVSMFGGPKGSTIAIRYFPRVSLVSINLDYYKKDADDPLLSFEECGEIERTLSTVNGIEKSRLTLPAIQRGLDFNIYLTVGDGRIAEYDFDEIVYNARSPFQLVQILHSKSLGNILVLDSDINLGERDISYTKAIIHQGLEDYKGKDVLILGGGDGGILNELVMNENPANVVMVEIDEMVVEACKKHLRRACWNILDSYEGEHYKIIIGNCLDYLKESREKDQSFDFIIADLTAIPILGSPDEKETLDFMRQVMNLSFEVLKTNGKYLTQGHSTAVTKAGKAFENFVTTLDKRVKFERTSVLIPSYLEEWTFYQVQEASSSSLKVNGCNGNNGVTQTDN